MQMKAWLQMRFAQVPPRGGLADAIRYTLSRWDLLCRFLNDGRVELDTNTVERAIRPITLGRKNHLFAGSDGGAHRWATVCSLITTAKLNDVEPFAYLRDVLERLSDGHPMSQLDDLLPWNWAPATLMAAGPTCHRWTLTNFVYARRRVEPWSLVSVHKNYLCHSGLGWTRQSVAS
jgi:hypothetical protein